MAFHRFTEAEKQFLSEYVPGHSHKEIQQAFIKKFNWDITVGQVANAIKRYGLNTGRTGRFEKGNVPCNKGKKMSPEQYAKAVPTMFKKGNVPGNYRPVGSERITKDGYIEIKIADPNKWRLKHLVVWESANGKKPKNCAIIFLDGDRKNTELSNLKLVTRRELLVMNRYDIHGNNAETMETAANLAKLIDVTKRKQREKNNGKN